MYCHKCGKAIRDDASFCSFCGEKVEMDFQKESNNPSCDKNINNSIQHNNTINNKLVVTEQQFITCLKCGQIVKKDAFVCSNCGAILKENPIYNKFEPNRDTNKYKFWQGRTNRRTYLMAAIFLGIPSHMCILSGTTTLIIIGIFLQLLWLIVAVRRCHDFDSSGYMCILLFIPIIAFVFGLYLLFKEGTPGRNGYGDEPL